MATMTASVQSDVSNLTYFQNWAMAVYNAITTLGWLQTADTGQMATPPGSIPASFGYWIFKSNDALSSTFQLYLKLEFGTNTNPRMRFTIGTGSSGAGVITGTSVGPWEFSYGANATNRGATTYNCYFSGDAGEFRMWLWQGISNGLFLGVERSKDATGASTDEYATVVCGHDWNNAGSGGQNTIGRTSGVLGSDYGLITTGLASATASAAGTVAALPVFPLIGKVGNPMLGWMTCSGNDVGVGSVVTVTSMYGGTHTYIAIKTMQTAGLGFSSAAGARTSSTQPMAILMRYE